MFDPTAFDNLKTVLEGAVYDADLDGSISVTGRKDLVDLAAMSRVYEIQFQLKESKDAAAVFRLAMSLPELSGELLKTNDVHSCEIGLTFHEKGPEEFTFAKRMIEEDWGVNFKVRHQVMYDVPFKEYSHIYHVQFGRSISEDHVDDLMAMTEHAITTLEKIAEGGS
ncbi:hypothetical protein SLL00_18100 [Metabacillus indicus]|uniref:hypothetical protein n=1 Tax=Metabacillus indicus TaxID=246786 RepID=UPI002A0268B9|nr:hypothetical protein [Metabacillus indicus]MDX8291731.1 hypothetical protein [Metabacillus indicus]